VTAQRLQQGRFFYDQDHRGEQAALYLLQSRPRPALVGVLSRKIDIASHYSARFLPEGERDETSMSRAVEGVYRYEDDLVGRLIAAAGPGVSVLVVSDHGFERSGGGYDHKDSAPPGIFIASGPAFARGVESPPVSVYDMTPTILHVLGLPVGRDMRGRVLEELLVEPREVGHIATYETGRRGGPGPKSPVEDDLREQLRSLGYIQ
jgi:arylsulfatase A-like enzyme